MLDEFGAIGVGNQKADALSAATTGVDGAKCFAFQHRSIDVPQELLSPR